MRRRSRRKEWNITTARLRVNVVQKPVPQDEAERPGLAFGAGT
jgi:hypothetical protein